MYGSSDILEPTSLSTDNHISFSSGVCSAEQEGGITNIERASCHLAIHVRPY